MENSRDQVLALGRLVALAMRCEAEGQLNLSKLLEAAVYSQIRRASRHAQPTITAGITQTELAGAIDLLAHDGSQPELVAALESGRRALAEGRHGDMRFAEAPDAFVCMQCGHLSMGETPSHCPECGAWPGTFRRFVAIFNFDHIEPVNPTEIISLLGQNADALAELLGDMSDEIAAKSPPAGGWSMREHVVHFRDAQRMFDVRLEQMLRFEDPELTAAALYEDATRTEERLIGMEELLRDYRERRAAGISQLASLTLRDWWRSGRHPEFGRISILRQAIYIAFHEQAHLHDVEALKHQVLV